MNQGIFDIPAEQYHTLKDCLSAGIAEKLVFQSPAHAKHAIDHPDAEQNGDTDRGTIGHDLLLEGVNRVCVIDPNDYPSKQGGIPKGWTNNAIRAARDEARGRGQIPLLKDDSASIIASVEAARRAWESCPDFEGYRLADGEVERSVIWQEGESWGRCRPDYWSRDRRLMVDAKFSKLSANPETFARQIASMAYDLRAAWYVRGALSVTKVEPKYVFLVQECEEPFATSFIGVSPGLLALGEAKVAHALRLWHQCIGTGKWPAYSERIHWAEPPGWAESQWMEREAASLVRAGIPYDPAELYKGTHDGN